jgi:hypothetical protein
MDVAQQIDLIFFATRNATFVIPTKYFIPVLRNTLRFAMEQLWDGTEESRLIIYAAYEKWAGEPYSDSDSDEEGEL